MQAFDRFLPTQNIVIEFFLMVPVVRQRRVDLSKCKVRMLETKLVWAPAICTLIEDQFNDFHRRPRDEWYTFIVKDDMLVARFRKDHDFPLR